MFLPNFGAKMRIDYLGHGLKFLILHRGFRFF